MTLLQLIREAYIASGEPSDLQYYVADRDTPDIDAIGNLATFRAWQTWIDAVNEAQLSIATWKFPNNRQLRFRFLEEYTSFQSAVETVTLGAATGLVVPWTTTGTALTATDAYKGRIIFQAATSATCLIVRSYTSGGFNYFVLTALGALAAGTAVVSKREYEFEDVDFGTPPIVSSEIPWDYDNGRPLEILEVVDSTTTTALDHVGRNNTLLTQTPARAAPSEFYRTVRGLRFNTWPEDARSYLVRFYRSPRPFVFTDQAVEPEFPIQFHQAVYLWLVWWGMVRKQESSDAYARRKDLENFLATRRTELDILDASQDGQVTFYPEGT
jgi:hypothetical protein